MTTRSITQGQEKQYRRFVEDAAERALSEAGLDRDGLQRLIEKGDKFQAHIIRAIRELSTPNQFAGEKVASSYAYPKDYEVKGIPEQVATLRLLPGLENASFDESIATMPLPRNAEGWFAIPRWQALAPTYDEAVEQVLAAIKSTRNFYNYREGLVGLQQQANALASFQKLGDEQKGHDILIVPCQFGSLYGGRSVLQAYAGFAKNEFGLGAFAIANMLLTHPEREVGEEQLHVYCAGDFFSADVCGSYLRVPFFGFDNKWVEFNAIWSNEAREYYGSASGFLLQQ